MKDRKHGKTPNSGKAVRDAEAAAQSRTGDEDCRCKEVSKKSFRELFTVMLKDFSFRKQRK
ncbi:MAG: hypothetical protein OHK006_23420 [Thermodesulfovibrionales bacterium]